MIITKMCSTCEHYPNDKHCIGCLWDKDKKENTKWELKKNPIVIERKVLEQIRTEIEQNAYPIVHGVNNHEKGMTLYGILQIIDKYK